MQMKFDVPQLRKADLEKPRKQEELRVLLDELYARFAKTRAGKRAIRLNEGELLKQLTEELWPLSLFADAFYRSRRDVLFQLAIDSPTYDALILESDNTQILHCLQITQAFDGYQEYLRMLHLEEYGRAPVTGPPLKKDRATGSVPETTTDAVRHDDLLAQTFEQLRIAVNRKSRMRYEQGTSLIVEFKAYFIDSEEDRRQLDEFVRSQLLHEAEHFAGLYLVSGRDGFALSYDLR
jgi:hypothetical protein